MDGVALLTITVLAVFVGFEVVSKVSSTLHTPLMSGANAIHGIILVGAIIVAGQASDRWMLAIALLAVVLATANLVGGFVVTDRMLEMFRGRKAKPRHPVPTRPAPPVPPVAPARRRPVDDPPLPHLDRAPLPGRRRLLHPRPQGAQLAPDRPPRQPDRRRRRAHRGRHRVPLVEARQHPVDPRRHRRRARPSRRRWRGGCR